jgi:hypothetical protein
VESGEDRTFSRFAAAALDVVLDSPATIRSQEIAMFNVDGTGTEPVKAATRRIGRFFRRIWDWSSGDDLHEAQMHRSDDHEFRVNPGGGLGF